MLKRKSFFKRRGKFHYNKDSAWTVQRAKLKRIFEEKGIMSCEMQLPGCFHDNFLSFAHRHKRIFYKKRGNESLLGAFNQLVLACIPCHQKQEINRGLTLEIFERLRGKE